MLPVHPKLKFSEAGLRGVVGETLLPPLITGMAGAFAGVVGPGALALGRDTRLSGPMVMDLVSAAFRGAGRDVVDLGICPVPTIEYFIKTEGLPGGIDVTASHNPPEWNALKFIGAGGYFLDRDEAKALRTAYEKEISWKRYDSMGRASANDTAIARHIDRILSIVDVDLIRSRKFTVAIDCVNGSAALATPRLLEALGCTVRAIHMKTDQPFPHPPEPKPENLADLIALTRDSGADIGFAQDPDADRLALVAENGRPLSEEYTLVLAAEHVLSKNPGRAVVGNLSGSRMLEDVAARYGSACVRTEIGEINVSKELRRLNGAVGGEGNGGVMIPSVHEGRDSFTGIALILELMAERKMPVGAIVDSMPKYSMLKFQREISPERIPDLITAIEANLGAGASFDTRDGIKLSWADRWVHVRGSNTEPIIRIMAEAPTDKEAADLIERSKAFL